VVLTATDRSTHQTAATTAASIHLHYEGAVIETPLAAFLGEAALDGVAVVAPERGLVEWFPSDSQKLGALAGPSRVHSCDWAITVIVPAVRMGEAHRALRGAPLTLQPWWPDGESVRFGGPEVP
jgi:hypothetical protein